MHVKCVVATLLVSVLLAAQAVQAEVVTIDVALKAIDAKERSITVKEQTRRLCHTHNTGRPKTFETDEGEKSISGTFERTD